VARRRLVAWPQDRDKHNQPVVDSQEVSSAVSWSKSRHDRHSDGGGRRENQRQSREDQRNHRHRPDSRAEAADPTRNVRHQLEVSDSTVPGRPTFALQP
jgi:hypothetical protein